VPGCVLLTEEDLADLASGLRHLRGEIAGFVQGKRARFDVQSPGIGDNPHDTLKVVGARGDGTVDDVVSVLRASRNGPLLNRFETAFLRVPWR